MKAGGKKNEHERARQSDKVTSCPCMVNCVCSMRPSPWRLKQTWYKCNRASSSLPTLAFSCTPRPSSFLSVFTLYSPNTHSASFHTHQSDKKTKLQICLSSIFSFHPPLQEIWPPRFINDLTSAIQTTWCTLRRWSSFEKDYLCVCVCTVTVVCLHNGVTNWLFCSNDNISQWFFTAMWLNTMSTLAWLTNRFLKITHDLQLQTQNM